MDKEVIKNNLGIGVMGDFDSGKSTTIGHLLFKTGKVDEKELSKLEKLSNDIHKSGNYKFAFISDKLKMERDKKHSIEASRIKLETKSRVFTMYDLPGHISYLGNFVAGTSLGDAALLVVSAEAKEYEKGFSNRGQTKQHALLAYTMGMKQIIVGINKMDLVSYNQEIFNQYQDEILQYLLKVGFEKEHISFIPYSGSDGDNLTTTSEFMKWYKGPTLMQALESLKIPLRHADKPLRIPIHNLFKVSGVGLVAVGVIKYGTIKPGDKLVVCPTLKTATCLSIRVFHNDSEKEARAGDDVGVCLSGVTIKDFHSGFVIGHYDKNPPKEAKSFQAHIILLNQAKTLKKDSSIIVDCQTSQIDCKINLLDKLDRKTGKDLMKNPGEIENGDAALIEFTPKKPMVVEKFEDFPSLGRICLRNNNEIIAVGIVKSVIHK